MGAWRKALGPIARIASHNQETPSRAMGILGAGHQGLWLYRPTLTTNQIIQILGLICFDLLEKNPICLSEAKSNI